MLNPNQLMIIFYVADLEAAKNFYEMLLNVTPALDDPGMVEFPLTESTSLGLMPIAGIESLLAGEKVAKEGALKAELYCFVDDPARYLQQAEALGGRLLSPPEFKSWGDKVGYCADLDGHVLAFAARGCAEG